MHLSFVIDDRYAPDDLGGGVVCIVGYWAHVYYRGTITTHWGANRATAAAFAILKAAEGHAPEQAFY